MTTTLDVSRRSFLSGSAAALGGLSVRPAGQLVEDAGGHLRRRRDATGDQRLGGGAPGRDGGRPHRSLRDGAGHPDRPRPARGRGARMRLGEGDHGTGHLPWQPRPQAPLGRHVDRRQPRHPRLAGLRPSRRRRRSHAAAAGRRQRVAGPSRRSHGRAGRDHARPFRPLHELRQGGRARFRLNPSGPEGDHAEGAEDLDDRGPAREAARYGGQAQRPQGLRDRRQAAGHAVRGG